MTQADKIKAYFTKLRTKMAHSHIREVNQLNRAEAAALRIFALRIFEKPVAPTTNGARTPRVRGARLNPDVQKAVLAAMATDVGYTVNEIADLSHAGRSQVKTALEIAMKAGTVAGDLSKRNRKYVLTTTSEAANA